MITATTSAATAARYAARIDALTAEWNASRCGCDAVREGSAGSFSYAALGVRCPSCEGFDSMIEQISIEAAKTPAERVADRWADARATAEYLGARWNRSTRRPRPSMASYGIFGAIYTTAPF